MENRDGKNDSNNMKIVFLAQNFQIAVKTKGFF